MRGMLASRLVWPSKWVGQAVMDNRKNRQGLDGRPRKNLAFLTSESGSPKKWFAIAYENLWNKGYACFGAHLKLVRLAVMANCLHSQGLIGRPQKNLAFLTSKSGSPKKWFAIAYENCRNWGMLASGLVWPWKWVGLAVMANWLHKQSLDRRPHKNLAFLTTESGSPKKWFAIAHENRRNEGYARFRACLTLQMGRTGREGIPEE